MDADCRAFISSCFDFGFWTLDSITNHPFHRNRSDQVDQTLRLPMSAEGNGWIGDRSPSVVLNP
jgi:hypothetical protein